MRVMHVLMATVLMFYPAVSSAQVAVGLICFDREEVASPIGQRNFVIVMEQTNSDRQDGAVALSEQSYVTNSPEMDDILFRVRVFKAASDLLDEVALDVLGSRLMAASVPEDRYQEWNDGVGYIKIGKLSVSWDNERASEFINRDIEYIPGAPEKEIYDDSVTQGSRLVSCMPPFAVVE